MHFADRVYEAVSSKDSRIIVGLDPQPALLPPRLRERMGEADPRASARALLDFNRLVIDAVADLAVAVKPQLAYYEVYGHRGLEAMELTNRDAHRAGLLVICDAKRGDIGPTAQAYAQAFLTRGPDDSWGIFCDAMTVNPYLGTDGLAPFAEQAAANEKGLFILARTSNPSAAELQEQKVAGRQVQLYEAVGALIEGLAAGEAGAHGYSLVGAVVGATDPEAARRLRAQLPASLFLVPGYGAQGGDAGSAAACFDQNGFGAIVSASRSVIGAGSRSENLRDAAKAIRQAATAMREEINRVVAGR